jgi:rSAM/selenodomain-associated transferase 1
MDWLKGMPKSAAIGIMCKAPRPGSAKTRLAATIGVEAAARLSACFLRDVAATIEAVSESLACRGYGVYAPAGSENELREILPSSFGLLLQADAEFGNVLHGAAHDLLAWGHDCVTLVNSDSPTLPPAVLAQAVEAMRQPGDRMVLGPAVDGGYYLIGLKAPHRPLFTNIPWGTEAVAKLTLERAAQIGLETMVMPDWYDIDDAETLGWLRDELAGTSARFKGGGVAAATRAWLAGSAMAAE